MINPSAKVNNGILNIVTHNCLYRVPVEEIKCISVINGKVYVNYNGRSLTLHESYYPIIADALCNAPETTQDVKFSGQLVKYEREF